MSLGLISGYGSDSGSDQESGEKEEQGYQVGQRLVTLARAPNSFIARRFLKLATFSGRCTSPPASLSSPS